MDAFRIIDLSIYAQLILIYLFIFTLKNSSLREKSTKLFIGILIAISFNNVLEFVSWIFRGNGEPWAYYTNYIIVSLLLAFNSVPAAVWIRYIDYNILGDYQKASKRFLFYLIPFYISSGLIIANVFTGVVFELTRENIYSRNIGLYIITTMSFMMVIVVFIASMKYKKQISGRIMQSIFWYLTIPLCAGLTQVLFFGLPLIWPAFTLATLISFNLIVVDTFLKDPLTKLNTRGQFESRLNYMLKRSVNFSIIMIDLNDFKMINDNFGHKEGDIALITVASILNQSTKRYDSVCRYGGDEFMLLIESDKAKASEDVIKRISDSISNYNEKAVKPYKLSLCYGHTYIDHHKHEHIKDVLAHVDENMYIDKNLRKSRGESIFRD